MLTAEPAMHGGFGSTHDASLCFLQCGGRVDVDPISLFGVARSGGASARPKMDRTGQLRWTLSYGRNGAGDVLTARAEHVRRILASSRGASRHQPVASDCVCA